VQLCIALLWAVGKFCAANLCEIAAFFSGSFDADDAELPQIRLTKTETGFGFVDGSNPDCLTKPNKIRTATKRTSNQKKTCASDNNLPPGPRQK